MTEQPEPMMSPDVTSDDKLWALLSYIPILVPWLSIIFLLFLEDRAKRPFLRYHLIQALAWGVVWVLSSVVIVGVCLSPLAIIASIYFAIQAYQGQYFTIPLLTDFLKSRGWLSAEQTIS